MARGYPAAWHQNNAQVSPAPKAAIVSLAILAHIGEQHISLLVKAAERSDENAPVSERHAQIIVEQLPDGIRLAHVAPPRSVLAQERRPSSVAQLPRWTEV